MKNRAVILAVAVKGDEEQFALLQKNLQWRKQQYEIIRFCNVQGFLDALNGLTTAETVSRRPYLLFLDFQTPQLDGLKILDAIKSKPQTKKIPVFGLIAANDEQLLTECYRHGCGLCFYKPSVYDRLVDMMQRLGDFLSIIELPELAAVPGWEQSNDQRNCNGADC